MNQTSCEDKSVLMKSGHILTVRFIFSIVNILLYNCIPLSIF